MSAPVHLPPPCPACFGCGDVPCAPCGESRVAPTLPDAMVCMGCGCEFRACVCDVWPDALDEAAGEDDDEEVIR